MNKLLSSYFVQTQSNYNLVICPKIGIQNIASRSEKLEKRLGDDHLKEEEESLSLAHEPTRVVINRTIIIDISAETNSKDTFKQETA